MRVGFVTCVQLGLSCMEAIYDAGGRLEFAGTLLDTQAVAKSGRVYLDEFCGKHRIPLTKFRNVNDAAAVAAIRDVGLDWLFIVGWSQIAHGQVLETPKLGVLGMHPTLLPVGRGRAAIPWAILLGLPVTGVTLFKLDGGVDTGPVAAQEVLAVGHRETATSLYRRVNEAHRTLILKFWSQIESGTLQFTPQDESRVTVWEGRTPDQGQLDLGMRAEDAERLIRAVTRPYPGAFIDLDGRRLRVWAAEPANAAQAESDGGLVLNFADGALRVTDLEWVSQGG